MKPAPDPSAPKAHPVLPTAADAVADGLRRDILSGALAGGERVMQDALAVQYGVSQTIVREAFKQLVVEGFLRAEPRRGVSVARLLPEEAEELVALRSAVEVQALAWALPRMTGAVLDAAGRVLAQLEQASSSDEVIRLNALFHDTLYAPAARERTLSLVVVLRRSFDRYHHFVCEATGHVPASQQEHRELLALCVAGDVDGACALLRRHIVGTGEVLAERLRVGRG